MNRYLIEKLKEVTKDMSMDMLNEVVDYAEYLQNKDRGNNIKEIVQKILKDTVTDWNIHNKTEVELEGEFEKIEDIGDHFSYTFLLECIRQDIERELKSNHKCIIEEKKKELLKIGKDEYNFFVFFDINIDDLESKNNIYSERIVAIVNTFQVGNIIIINKIEIPKVNH